MQGRIQDAQTLLHANHADMLESVLHPNLDVVIFFHCLQYIELIRWALPCVLSRRALAYVDLFEVCAQALHLLGLLGQHSSLLIRTHDESSVPDRCTC